MYFQKSIFLLRTTRTGKKLIFFFCAVSKEQKNQIFLLKKGQIFEKKNSNFIPQKGQIFEEKKLKFNP